MRCLLVVAPMVALHAQAPAGWNHREALGGDLPATPSWVGAGLWDANQHGLPATLIDSLGMGNGYVGAGAFAEGGLNFDTWSFAIRGYADHDSQGRSRFTVMQSHALYHSPGGWVMGYEQEPMVWGYGLTGGYLLGEADRPVPKLKIESPMGQRSLFGASMGNWGWQTFLGRMENARELPDSSQMPLMQQNLINTTGDPQSPFLSGYRVQADFLEHKVEAYANLLVLWGGTLNGTAMTQGYGFKDYLTAITGSKDPVAESGINFDDPNHPTPVYKNKARSSGNFDMGARIALPILARGLAADKAWIYVSRGTKGMTVNWSQAYHQPLTALGSDVSNDLKALDTLQIKRFWGLRNRYYAPNLLVPNDTFGILAQWSWVRLGLEHQDTVNYPNYYRSFANNIYPTGFYHYGDPLGEATGGEASTTTLRLETDPSPRLSTTTWLQNGSRPFRDDLNLWSDAHPGATPTTTRFWGLQQAVAWQLNDWTKLEARASWMRQIAYQNIPTDDGNGFRWSLELAFRLPADGTR